MSGSEAIDNQVFFLVLGAAIAVVSAAITSFIQSYLEARRQRSAKWWERKVDAYSAVLESLHQLKFTLDREMNDEVAGGRILTQIEAKSLQENWKTAMAHVAKATDMGAFIVRADAVEQLAKLQKRFWSTGDWDPQFGIYWEYLNEHWMIVNECLNSFRAIALDDLEVPSTRKSRGKANG